MPKQPLQVRRYVWQIEDRTEMKVGKRWRKVKDLEAARDYARCNGYSGIKIEPR